MSTIVNLAMLERFAEEFPKSLDTTVWVSRSVFAELKRRCIKALPNLKPPLGSMEIIIDETIPEGGYDIGRYEKDKMRQPKKVVTQSFRVSVGGVL